jgi:hypothetical protein
MIKHRKIDKHKKKKSNSFSLISLFENNSIYDKQTYPNFKDWGALNSHKTHTTMIKKRGREIASCFGCPTITTILILLEK